MNNGELIIVIIAAGLLGRKSILRGGIFGVVISLVLYFIIESFQIKSFCSSLAIGAFASFGSSILTNIISSGLNGGNHNTSPSFMGFRSFGSGFVNTDDEKRSIRQKKEKK